MGIQAVLFDHDGTLVDSEARHCSLWQALLTRYGVALSVTEYAAAYAGMPTARTAELLVQRYALPIAPAALAAEKFARQFEYLRQHAYPLMPGAAAVLDELRGRGLRLAVVTGAPRASVTASLQAHALAAYFEVIVSGDEVAHNKPAPDGYQLALQRLQLPAADAVAVEDSAQGLAAAIGAGLRCLAVPHALSAAQDFSAASAILPGLDAVAVWLTAQQSG